MIFLQHLARLALPLALVVVTGLVYWPGLSGGFLFDDFPNIVTNTRVHAKDWSWETLKQAAGAYAPGPYGRPLATLTFAADWAIGGKDAWQFKLTGLLVHLINAVLVFWLLRRIFDLPTVRGQWGRLGAFAVALLWAVHPLQVSSVLYVVQRMETLALTFVLLALIAYMRGRVGQLEGQRGWPWLCGSGLLAGIGMLSKETAVLFPAYALALELTLLRFEARTTLDRRLLQAGYATGIIIGLLVFLFLVAPPYLSDSAFSGRSFNLGESLLTQLRVLPMYLGQMLLPLPSHLTFYYDDFAKSTGWMEPATTLAGGLFLLALLALTCAVRRKMPLVALGVFWFFAAHLLTSNVFNLELVFEHRNYFALLGIVLALADLVRRIPMRDGPALKYAAVGIIVVGFGGLALLRSATWGNPLHLAMELVALNPKSERASNDLATLYVGMSDSNPNSPLFRMGALEFERGSRLQAASPLPEQGLILMAATTGQPVKDAWWDRLTHKIRTRPVGPQETMAVTGLMKQRYRGVSLDDQRLSEAYDALLQRAPQPHLYAMYGDFALTYLGDNHLANRMFRSAVEQNPGDRKFAERLLGTLVEDGRFEQARAVMTAGANAGLFEAPEPVPSQ